VRTAWSHVASSPPPEGDPFHVWFWFTSRMMPGQPSITEFPSWTFLFADLHAHLIAIPFALLAVGLALNLVMVAEQRGFRWSALAVPLTALALAVGSLAAINTWDYPTYLFLALGAVLLAAYASRRLDVRLLAQAALGVAVVAGLSYIAFLPFHQHYVGFNLGIHSSGEQTSLPSYLAVHGLFLFLVVSYLVYEAAGHLRTAFWQRRSSDVPSQGLVRQARGTQSDSPLLPVALAAAGALVAYMVAAGYATVALLFVVALGAVLLGVRHLIVGGAQAPYHLFLLALVVGAFGLGIAVDLVTLNNDIDRMNTVFKLYLQAWVLYGVASATILWYLVASGRNSIRKLLWAKGLWLLLLLVLVAGVSVFPVMGTRVRLAERFSTAFAGLNGARYMDTGVYYDEHGPIDLHWDWEAIQWLRDNVRGSPVLAEANTTPHNYRWGARVSIYTGLPTIVGWDWHQTQQRSGDGSAVRKRLEDTAVLYNTPDMEKAKKILHDYGVKYVYVGKLERLYYSRDGLAKFPRMVGRGLTLVYTNPDVDNPEVEIYQVNLVP
ncbi:MAG: DUF2298 domain-containing protein, partial [Chloroflexota bacterium]